MLLAAGQARMSRRHVLQVLGTGAVAAGVGGSVVGCSTPASDDRVVPVGSGPTARTRVVLLGTAGGPVFLSPDRAGISTAVVYEDRVYAVDLGYSSHHRLAASGVASDGTISGAFAKLRGVFFTHLHTDHLAEWPALYAMTSGNALGRPQEDPVRVFGPPNRGVLPRVYPPGRPEPAVVNPDSPTPGIVEMTEHLRRAWASDLNDRLRDTASLGPSALFQVQDIDVSSLWTVSPEGIPPRVAAPIPVWTDGDVRITATLVDHRPTAPAFAYRFDTPDGSVVVSGDTGPSENLVELARDTDYLVHEVIDEVVVAKVVEALPPDQQSSARQHLLGAHTTIPQVGGVAEAAGARSLVLTHLFPANNPVERWKDAGRGYSGELVVGSDLQVLDVNR